MAKNVIHIFGASGSGTSTLGKKISELWGYTWLDTDDYFWEPTNPPFQVKREISERLRLIKEDMEKAESVVLTGSLTGWGDELIPFFTLVVRVVTATELRLERIKAREQARFGERIAPGGDMYEQHLEFLDWAGRYDTGSVEMRSKAKHDEWQKLLDCPIVVVDGADDPAENCRRIESEMEKSKRKNIFIEGIQGTGKTTLLRLLGQQLPDYHVYWEGDYSPVELAWCTYMTEPEYEQALVAFPDLMEEIKKRTTKEGEHFIVEYTRILAERRAFYEYMERYEIYNARRPLKEFKEILLERYAAFTGEGNIFECSFFQNTVEELLLYYDMTEQEILAFYRELFAQLKDKNFVLLYLQSDAIEENILQIKKERSDGNGNEMWYPLMLRYLNDTPYGKIHPFEGVADMAAHFRRRMQMEIKIIEEVLKEQAIILLAKEYQIEDVVNEIKIRNRTGLF